MCALCFVCALCVCAQCVCFVCAYVCACVYVCVCACNGGASRMLILASFVVAVVFFWGGGVEVGVLCLCTFPLGMWHLHLAFLASGAGVVCVCAVCCMLHGAHGKRRIPQFF